MNTATDSDNWRKKYFDSLSSLETEQRQFRVMETTLKRLAGRLCSASLGQSSRLDEQIKKLQTALRREASSDELEQITPALTDAIQALDQSTTASSLPAPVAAAAPAQAQPLATLDEERIRAILSALLVELRRDAELIEQADTLDAKLSSSMTAEQLPEVLASLTEMVGLRIKRIETARQEIAALLSHMVGKLDEIGQFVADQNQSQSQSQASSETLNLQLVGEMKVAGGFDAFAHLDWRHRTPGRGLSGRRLRPRRQGAVSGQGERPQSMRQCLRMAPLACRGVSTRAW